MRDLIPAPHRLGTIGNTIHPRDPARPGRRTHRGIIEAIQIAKPLLGQLVNGRGLGIFPTIATDPGNPVIFASDPENVWFLRCVGRSQSRAQEKESGEYFVSEFHRALLRARIPESINAIDYFFNSFSCLRTKVDCPASRICQQARPFPTRSHSSNSQTTFFSFVISKICGSSSPA